jgi:ankyrin repeat protein
MVDEYEIDEDVKLDILNDLMVKAIESDSAEVVTFLIKNGADIHKNDEHGNAIFHRCIRQGNVEMVRAFINTGKLWLDDMSNDLYCRTAALCEAAFYGHIEIAALLIDSGAAIDIRDIDGFFNTPLIAALSAKRLGMFDFLLKKGADIDFSFCELISGGGDDSAECDYKKMVEIFLENGANPNILDEFGEPMVSVAANSENFDIVCLLIESGADLNVKNEEGMKAREVVCRCIDKYLKSSWKKEERSELAAKRLLACDLKLEKKNRYDRYFDMTAKRHKKPKKSQ